MAVRHKIKEIAESQGYNMSSLSRQADVQFVTIRRIWRDPFRNISMDTLGKIARVLGVAPGELIEEVSKPEE